MTYNTTSIEDILHDYERTRLANKRVLQDRKAEIYARIPRIADIDEASALSYLSRAKERILGKTAPTIDTSSNRELTVEKRRLLTEHGYPEDYLEPIYSCPHCQDTGYTGQTKCQCFLDKIIDTLYLQSNLKNILSKENFDTFSMEYYSKDITGNKSHSPYDNMSNIVDRCKSFTEMFEKVPTNRGNILIYGETGLGKTFLTNCIAKELLDNNHSVLYLSANELFEQVLGGYLMQQKKELEDLYRYIYNCELLIIDDLGTELTNNFVTSQLFEIINKRELEGLSTLISTNLNMMQLRDRYSERIMSRFIANYTVFNIYGDNIRYQKRKKAINSIT